MLFAFFVVKILLELRMVAVDVARKMEAGRYCGRGIGLRGGN